ncbi:VanW family protein [Alicyclobacillus sp. ALC3]|uniref:VanW family protein n=1 Tax=Alicyclobacillus sp. ALC3 TaxID=2796143 RepID=UPI003FCEDD6F
MAVLAKRLNGVIVAPGATFSYYRTVGPYTAENGFYWGRAFSGDRIVPSMGGGVCQGASTLYSALMRTDLKVVERHQHSLTVPYLPPGEDATVAGTYLDFKFKNSRATPVMLAATADLSRRYLTVAVWGKTAPPKITVKHEILATYPYRTIRHCMSKASEVGVKSPGQPGVKVKTWVVTEAANGSIERYLGMDTYKASPRIEDAVCVQSKRK